MKELKYNIIQLFKRKELYFAFIAITWIVLLHLLTIFFEGVDGNLYPEFMNRAEELSILNNSGMSLPLMYFAFPIICSFLFKDTSWMDSYKDIKKIEYVYLNHKMNMIIQWILSMVVSFLIVFIAFMLEYITLRYVFGSGFVYHEYMYLSFDLPLEMDELWNISKGNMWLYAIITSASVAMIFAFLSGISYSISLYIEKRRYIVIAIVVFMLAFDIFVSNVSLQISLLELMQPHIDYQITKYLLLYVILFVISFIPLFIKLIQPYKKV